MSRAVHNRRLACILAVLFALCACAALTFTIQTAHADEPDSASSQQLEAGSIDYAFMEGENESAESGASEGDGFSDIENVEGFGIDTVYEDLADESAQVSEKKGRATRRIRSGETVSYAVFPYVPNPSTEQFVASIAEPAREIGQREGLYASVMIAQASLESGSGSSGLSKPPYNNLFGIKGSYKGASVVLMTSEDDGTGNKYDIAAGFRRYPSVKESLEDYAKLLKRDMGAFYAPAWKANAKTYVQACNYLQGHYATDTSYSGKLQGLIIAYNLVRYDHPAGWNAKDESQEERSAEIEAAFENSGAMALAQGTKPVTDTTVNGTSESIAESPTASTSDQAPLSDPGVQVSLVSLGALALFFSKNEIALLLAALK